MVKYAQNQGGEEGGGGGGEGGGGVEMDSDGLSSRMERTFWTVWSFISGAVSRFLRAEPTNTSRNDPDANQESPADSGLEVRPMDVREEQPLSTVSVICSSQPVVAWERCATDTDVGPNQEDTHNKRQPSRDGEGKASAESQPTRDEDLHQSSNDAGDGNVEEYGDWESHKTDLKQESDERTASPTLAGDATSEDVEKSGKKSSERLATVDDHRNVDAKTEIREDDGGRELKEGDAEEGGVHMEEVRLQRDEADAEMMGAEAGGSDGVLQQASQNEGLPGRAGRGENQLSDGEESSQDDGDNLQTARRKSPLVAVGSEHVTRHGSRSGQDEEERGALTEGEHVKQAVSGVGGEMEKEKSVPVDGEENVSAGHDARSPITHGEQCASGAGPESHMDVTDTKSHVTAGNSPNERLLDEDLVEEERPCRECDQEVVRATSSVAAKPEGDAGEETSGYLESVPSGKCEGRLAVSHEETQKAVPECNNERGPDKNTAQRFLEEPEYQETHATPSLQEAGSGETENLQSRSCGAGADYSLEREHMEEEGEGAEEIQSSSDVVVEDGAGERRPADAGLARETETRIIEPVKEEGDLVSVEIEPSEKEPETCVTLTELLMEPAVSEGLGEVRDDCQVTGAAAAQDVVKVLEITEAELPEITETSYFENSEESDQKSCGSAGLQEGLAESGSLEQSAPTGTAGEQDVMREVEEAGFGFEEEAEEDEVQIKNKMEIVNQQVAADQPSTDRNEKESTLRTPVESEPLETNNQMSGKEEAEAADETMTAEAKPRDVTTMSAEEVAARVTESESVGPINQEILDPRMHPPPHGIDDTGQPGGPEPGREMDTELEPPCEEKHGILPVQTGEEEEEEEEDEEQLLESNSDTEMSTSTAESGFSEQSLCDCAAQTDVMANVSESTGGSERSAQQPDSDSEDVLMGETDETRRTCVREEKSSEASSLNEELNKLQEDPDRETGSEDEIGAEDTDSEDVEGAESSIELRAPFKVVDTNDEDEPQEMIKSGSPGPTEHVDSGRSAGSSEDISEEGDVPTESQDAACDESGKPQPEEAVDSLSGLNRAEDAQLATRSSDEMEVDFALLDSTALRSRIAVKNPQVRPPTNPRALLLMPSVPPTPPSHLPVKVPAGLGFGVKLPELGVGFPALKKTQQVEREAKSEEEGGAPRQDGAKPRRVLPRHPGFGNPLMSELKSRLKKTGQADKL